MAGKLKKDHPTRWKPGESGNPSGRPGKGAAIRRQLMEMTPEAVASLKRGIEAGDVTCLRIWAERCDPSPKSTFEPVEFLCDTTDQTRAALSVIAAISKGQVAPDVGTQIIAGIAAAAKVAEVDEIRRELEELQKSVEEIQNDHS